MDTFSSIFLCKRHYISIIYKYTPVFNFLGTTKKFEKQIYYSHEPYQIGTLVRNVSYIGLAPNGGRVFLYDL